MKVKKLIKEILAFCGAIFNLVIAPLIPGVLLLEYLSPQTFLEQIGAGFLASVLWLFLWLCSQEWLSYVEERTENITKEELLKE